MVTPVINNIVPFDVGVGTVFTFQYTGGITDSYFEIFDVNNIIIYDSIYSKFNNFIFKSFRLQDLFTVLSIYCSPAVRQNW